MIRPDFFYDLLIKNGTDFFTGVPDSLLKNFCAYLTDTVKKDNHIIAANEGGALGLAAGHYFATENIPLVYMQNSGLGNTVNPILSLADKEVYSVPILLLIGWRGEPNVHDEPQHIKQGKITCELLETMEIPYSILALEETQAAAQIQQAYTIMEETNAPYAFVVCKGTFDSYTLKTNENVPAQMSREEAIEEIVLHAPENAVFISTTGMASRELYELRDKHQSGHHKDFLTVGSMGHASQIALGIALEKPNVPVFCLDGDGAALMHMGGMAIIGTRKPQNILHIVFNNGAHDSVGGQPTVARNISLCDIARSCGYEYAVCVKTKEELDSVLKDSKTYSCLTFIEILVTKGARSDLGRPKSSPLENKQAFMAYLKGVKK
ncbi:phosphonopyruvate decarboxylase [Treponema phagedenis]|uniref:phosphonopyruvate decarboxylase n=1 Tax=Treponema phagedenis TaxID=162 RepID=UPI0011E71285|nr:phosphonopyruvate decarboxylase [Treponema phagedenis]QEK09183.1 phosphonopyruvate decarboxylase [Treponema phagedenis]